MMHHYEFSMFGCKRLQSSGDMEQLLSVPSFMKVKSGSEDIVWTNIPWGFEPSLQP